MSILCLVPSPLAAARASRRLCDAQDGILFGPRVSTLERLADGILAERGERRPVLSPLAERLLVADAARRAGGALAGARPDGGLAAALAAAVAELRRGEVTSGDARAAAASLEGGGRERLLAVAEVLASFEDALAGLGALDRAGAARAAADRARRGPIPGADDLDVLVVDGIAAVSPAEGDLLAALVSRARRTRVHLPYFPDRPDLSSPAEPLLRRLEALHEAAARRDVEVVLPAVHGDGRAPRIAALLEAFGRWREAGSPGEGLVLAEPGAGEAGEAEASARVVARLLDAGLAPDDVVVVAPSPGRAAPALARAMAAAGIPFATGQGGRLSDAPPVRAIRHALAAAGGLDRTAVERLAASTYLAPRGAPAGLGRLLDRAGAIDGRAGPQEALRARAAALSSPRAAREREALHRAASALDDLAGSLRPLAGAGTARQHGARLAAFVDALGVRRRAARAPRDVAARDLAAVSGLLEAAEGLAQALSLLGRGEERLDAAEYRALLSLAVDPASSPPPPEPAAGAVELHGLGGAPGLSARAAVLVGCGGGAWPTPPPPEPVLREPERRALCRHLRRAAVATAGARRAEATYRAFSAAAAAREALAFLWPSRGPAGDGGPPAPLVAEALAAIGVPVPGTAPPAPALALARTHREALRAAARAGRDAEPALSETPLRERARQARLRGEIEWARDAAVRARRASPHAGELGPSAAGPLAGALPAEWAPTQLERYAHCPFRLFLEVAVRIEEPGADGLDIDARDEGSLLHAVLERFVRGRVERGAWPPSGAEGDLAEARDAAERVFARFEEEGRTGDPAVWRARRDAVLARLDRVVRAEARDHGGLVPALLEHAFGGRSGRPPVAVAAGGEAVLLRGRIDRVDAGPDRLLVLDYKSGRAGRSGGAALLAPEAFGATSFQIPTYLLAAARELPGRPRLLATYSLLRGAERLEPVELSADAPVLGREAAAEGRALLGPAEAGRSFAGAVVDLVGRIRAGRFPIVSRGCERCPYGAVCRFPGVAELSAGEDAE